MCINFHRGGASYFPPRIKIFCMHIAYFVNVFILKFRVTNFVWGRGIIYNNK